MKRFPTLLLAVVILIAGGCSKQVLLKPSELKRPIVLGDLNLHLRNFAQDPFDTDDSSVLLMGMWQDYNSDITLNDLHSQLTPDLNKKVKSRLDTVFAITKYDLAKANLKLLPANTLKGISSYDAYGYPNGTNLRKLAARSGHDVLKLTVYLSADHLDTHSLTLNEYEITYRPEAVVDVKLVNPQGKTIWSSFADETSPRLMRLQDQVNGNMNMLNLEEGPHLAGLVDQGLTTLLNGLPNAA
ncbi:MAG TPA: hypothetical protein VKA08_07850 [Balneolales bacterium]|nr:hypothetical protein [Balneolales bacterium]